MDANISQIMLFEKPESAHLIFAAGVLPTNPNSDATLIPIRPNKAAGKGSKTDLRVKNFLVQNYGGSAENWQHSKGRGYIDTADGPKKAVIHWFYEENVGAKEIFGIIWSKK